MAADRCRDEAEIGRVLARYVRAVDRLDWELLRSCYHPDAREERGRFSGDLGAFVEWLRQTLGAIDSTWHLLGVPLIEFATEDAAWSETYCLGIHYLGGLDGAPDRGRQVPCRYCDRFERRRGEWRIAKRVVVYEPTLDLGEVTAALGVRSRRDRQDPGYGH